MIRSGECFTRYHNFPLAYKVKYNRSVPQLEMWDDKLRRMDENKKSHRVLKSENHPTWWDGQSRG